jgi:hypothetical protein
MRSIVLSLLLLACGGDNGGTTTSGGTTGGAKVDMAGPLSQCGHPGDTGNNQGVGAFCMHVSDCTGAANICSSLGNGPNPSAQDTYFCTIFPCQTDLGATNCGDNASCVCQTGSGGNAGCACVPKRCQ